MPSVSFISGVVGLFSLSVAYGSASPRLDHENNVNGSKHKLPFLHAKYTGDFLML